jgi:limonene-1,2-epoxide hydrolase
VTEIETVKAFLAALEAFDLPAAYTLVDDAIVYRNNNLKPARGRREFEKAIRQMTKRGDHFEARLHHIAADGNVVLTFRTDVLGMQGKRVEFWVWGSFEVVGGKIVYWHDYFDWAQFSGRAAAQAPGILFGMAKERIGWN